jgi:hypothetical protein
MNEARDCEILWDILKSSLWRDLSDECFFQARNWKP